MWGLYGAQKHGLTHAWHLQELMYEMVMGITYCHMHRLIHRDLKPQNILVCKKGVLKLADFGLARAFTRGQQLIDTAS